MLIVFCVEINCSSDILELCGTLYIHDMYVDEENEYLRLVGIKKIFSICVLEWSEVVIKFWIIKLFTS